MDESAKGYYEEGLRLINRGRYAEAVDLFSRAIEIDPNFSPAYKNRGEAYILLDRYVEGNTDIQRAKDIQSGKYTTRKQQKQQITKLNFQEIDNIYDAVFPDEGSFTDNEPQEVDDSLYDYIFTDDTPDADQQWDELAENAPETDSFPAFVEFMGGRQLEVAGAILSMPAKDAISIIGEDGAPGGTIPLEQLSCVRMAGVPEPLSSREKQFSSIEIIETIDGTVYHELIHHEQDFDDFLFGFSTKNQTRFPYTLIPRVNIRKRSQQSRLGEILLEKRFIANDILHRALDEFHHAKSMIIGKIIAQKSQILHSAIEEELEKARENRITGLKAGEILLASGLVNEQQVLEALDYQENIRNLRIGQFLIQKGIVQEREVYVSLAEKHRCPFIDLPSQKISRKILSLLPGDMVVQHEIIPVALENGILVVATHYVDQGNLCEEILKSTKCRQVQFALTQPTHIKRIISHLYKRSMIHN